jgi:hypothetical protein
MARKEGDKQTNREVLVEKKHEARTPGAVFINNRRV